MAAASIANIVKSSLGPIGLDKMLVDDVGVSLVHDFMVRMGRHAFNTAMFPRM
jgi:chaperonin GroEL (HSP60 family)